MAYFGVQWKGDAAKSRATEEFLQVITHFAATEGPTHFDRAHEIDAAGFDNLIAVAYWTDTRACQRWQADSAVAEWWNSPARLNGPCGYFREVLSPRLEQFETLFSTPDRMEGIGHALGHRSAEDVIEHAYWGSMRERIPLSQTDALEPAGALAFDGSSSVKGRIRIKGHENLALIRSGQEWTETEGKERVLYTSEMQPTLAAGMEFLRDQGPAIGCYANRYLRHLDPRGGPLEKTFGLSYWRSLKHLEQWAESHPTHLAIFGTFMRIVQELEFNLKLRLYHEVAVVSPDAQDYEYINCHPSTGLLRHVRPV
jgi:aldoxime dehydratase